MAVQKHPALSCFVALLLSSTAVASEDLSLKTIPIDTQPVAATAPHVDDGSEDNTRSFNHRPTMADPASTTSRSACRR